MGFSANSVEYFKMRFELVLWIFSPFSLKTCFLVCQRDIPLSIEKPFLIETVYLCNYDQVHILFSLFYYLWFQNFLSCIHSAFAQVYIKLNAGKEEAYFPLKVIHLHLYAWSTYGQVMHFAYPQNNQMIKFLGDITTIHLYVCIVKLSQ